MQAKLEWNAFRFTKLFFVRWLPDYVFVFLKKELDFTGACDP